MTTSLQPGKLVTLRGREWVVLPSDDPQLLVVKPLGGSDDEIAGIYLPLQIGGDSVTDARFERPAVDDLGDASTARLLYDSAGSPSEMVRALSVPLPSSPSDPAHTKSSH